MIMEAGARDLTIEEEPITYHPREGNAMLDSFRDGWRLVRYMLLNAPGYLFTVPGATKATFGVFSMSLALAAQPINGVSLGPHSMIASGLMTILGIQIAHLGVFATVMSDPIRAPADPLTNWITEQFQLEHGATADLLPFAAGASYAVVMVSGWVGSGFKAISLLQHDIAAFTAIVVGIQIIFSSFFLSAVSDC